VHIDLSEWIRTPVNALPQAIAYPKDAEIVCAFVQTKYAENEKHFADQNVKVVEDYTRLTDRFNSLQTKYHHFQRADAKKVEQVKEEGTHSQGLQQQLMRNVGICTLADQLSICR
jgi:hypothetical protein